MTDIILYREDHDEESEVTVSLSFVPGEKTTHWHPGTGDEWEVLGANDASGNPVVLTGDEQARAIEEAESSATSRALAMEDAMFENAVARRRGEY